MTLLDCQKQFMKDAKDKATGNAFIAFVVDEDKYHLIGRGPCHGAFSSGSGNISPKVTSKTQSLHLLSYVQERKVKEDVAERFYDYLFNRSPYKDIFITKTYKDALENGIVVDANHSHHLVASALIASRSPTENYVGNITERLYVFEDIKSLGFDENFAYIFSFVYSKTHKGQYQYTPVSSGHCCFAFGAKQEDYYRNFINNTPTNASQDTFFKNKGYGIGVTELWSSNRGEAFGKWLSQVKPKKVGLKVNLNIFEKIKTDTITYPTKEDFKNVLEQVKERIFNEK